MSLINDIYDIFCSVIELMFTVFEKLLGGMFK